VEKLVEWLSGTRTMTDFSDSIVPTPELVKQWYEEAPIYARDDADYEEFIARKAALWGANQELEACCKLLEECSHCDLDDLSQFASYMQRTRRPDTGLSLKERAIKLLDKIQDSKEVWEVSELNIVRRALDEIP
jgi:hypothetical protein